MARASVLTDSDIRRVFRIIETTRHAERNRLAFVLSIYAGLRVGEIAALGIGDVATNDGKVRRETKLGAHQTKGSKGRTVVLSTRVRREIAAYAKFRQVHHHDAPLIGSQRNGHFFSNVTLSMLFKEIYEMAGIRTSSHSGRRTFATRLNAKGVGMRTIQKLMGHRGRYCRARTGQDHRAHEAQEAASPAYVGCTDNGQRLCEPLPELLI